MECEKCKKERATVFLSQIIGGIVHKVDLCERCARKLGVTKAGGFSLASILAKEPLSVEDIEAKKLSADVECPLCGMQVADFKKAKRLGCPQCYDTFKDEVDAAIASVQKAPRHTGKRISRFKESIDWTRRRQELRQELAKAVEHEDFEKAAALRDELRAIENR